MMLQPVPHPPAPRAGLHRMRAAPQRNRPAPRGATRVLHVVGLPRQAGDDRTASRGLHPTARYTIGHSTRSVPELADLLRGAGADLVVDVRTVPRSRANPQFNADTLPEALAAYRIGYRHVRELGGLRGRR